MPEYLGKVSLEQNSFYNYKPLYRYLPGNDDLIELTESQLSDLLPESEKGDINIDYRRDSEIEELLAERFPKTALCFLDFSLEELEDNTNYDGVRNRTGYKLPARQIIEENKLTEIKTHRFFHIIPLSSLEGDFWNENIVVLGEHDGLYQGDMILLDHGDMMYGPYQVGHRNQDDVYYIRPDHKTNKYLVRGYEKNQVVAHSISYRERYTEKTIRIGNIKKLDNYKVDDIISDEELLNNFKESLEAFKGSDGQIKLSELDEAIELYRNSDYVGDIVPEDIRIQRFERLESILSANQSFDENTELVGELIWSLLANNPNEELLNEFFEKAADNDPKFYDNFQTVRAVQNQIDRLVARRDDYLAEVESLRSKREETEDLTNELQQQAVSEKTVELESVEQEINQLKEELEALSKKKKLALDTEELQAKCDELQSRQSALTILNNDLSRDFQSLIDGSKQTVVDHAFNGYISSKMLRAAAEWEAEETKKDFQSVVDATYSLDAETLDSEQMVDYLVSRVQKERPNYDSNTVLNIAICIAQGFLTVFSGEPGCGKTSICDIFTRTLGLQNYSDALPELVGSGIDPNRYVAVSVERGWTSKRDFIGYYNPLTKTFDQSNQRVFNALQLLDYEKQQEKTKYPMVILLDEANLSQIEFYWADFMNVCDNLDGNPEINLGENNVLSIPHTLRFLATINNDFTTDNLSPRLIDRAWVITLPETKYAEGSRLMKSELSRITWGDFQNAFGPRKDNVMPQDVRDAFENIVKHFRNQYFDISYRTRKTIDDYWSVAAVLMSKDQYETDASYVALDYAIAQKILPKIEGSGDAFEQWLKDLRTICDNSYLQNCISIIDRIIEKGNRQMKYYKFF